MYALVSPPKIMHMETMASQSIGFEVFPLMLSFSSCVIVIFFFYETRDEGRGTGETPSLYYRSSTFAPRPFSSSVCIDLVSIAIIESSFLVRFSISVFGNRNLDFIYHPLLSLAEPFEILRKCGYSLPNPLPYPSSMFAEIEPTERVSCLAISLPRTSCNKIPESLQNSSQSSNDIAWKRMLSKLAFILFCFNPPSLSLVPRLPSPVILIKLQVEQSEDRRRN